MMMPSNPFITNGYFSPHYFCDCVQEIEQLTRLVTNGNNVALISPRRLGKTGLINHCFSKRPSERITIPLSWTSMPLKTCRSLSMSWVKPYSAF